MRKVGNPLNVTGLPKMTSQNLENRGQGSMFIQTLWWVARLLYKYSFLWCRSFRLIPTLSTNNRTSCSPHFSSAFKIEDGDHTQKKVKGNTETPLDGEKEFSLVEGSSADPSFPGRAYDRGWYISFKKKKEKKKVANLLHEKQKVGLSRRVIRLACLPFCDGRITLLAGPTFLSVNTLARPAGSTPGQNATIRVCFLFSPINCLLNWIKLVRLGGWP